MVIAPVGSLVIRTCWAVMKAFKRRYEMNADQHGLDDQAYSSSYSKHARVPFADNNLLPLPDTVKDEEAIVLSDIACTGWHGVELGEVSGEEGRNNVAIWGMGPVGLMAARWALFRGAKKVVCIDNLPERLAKAAEIGCVPLDFSKEDVYETLKKHFTYGPDVGIDCVGFRYTKSWLHTVERAVNLETDGVDVVAEVLIVAAYL